ncbi:coiled-coil domain-containing protein 69 isoform X2 [Hyperolius riggenbachi]|uniref:coiled-coil domain-containing protein 69 isoform X2 n=1 Tax=Hyperolius riggenbachi TaxID=752182 RepID=UPI0035A37125
MGCKATKLCYPRSRRKNRQKETQQELNDVTGSTSCLQQKIKDYEEEIRTLLQRHQEEKMALEEAGRRQLEEQERALRDQARQDAAADLETRLAAQASALSAEMERKCEDLQRRFAEERTSLTETYEKLTTSLQETIAELSGQLASFQEKMRRVEESVLSQDYKIHIQMDRNVVLEERLHSLQQEGEALRAQAQNQAAMTIRLTEQLLNAQVALEKEKQLCEKLQRDKEQNSYRTVNGDGPPHFSLAMATQDVSIMVT